MEVYLVICNKTLDRLKTMEKPLMFPKLKKTPVLMQYHMSSQLITMQEPILPFQLPTEYFGKQQDEV